MSEAPIREKMEAGLAASGLPGVALAARTPDGQTATLGVGEMAVGQGSPMPPDALFWIASMTKALTSLAALQLVAEGRLGLDDSVETWLPQLKQPQVLEGFAAEGEPRLRPARRPITLRHLLTHTSGLAYDFAHADVARWVAKTGTSLLGRDPPAQLPLAFDPGEGWTYGYGSDFAGRLIEAMTGKDLGAVFAERILVPLGMADTTFSPTPEQRARIAPMHARLPDGGVVAIPFNLPEPPYFQMGGGGLYSTAGDYLKFLIALLARDERLLPAELMDLLLTSQVSEPRPGALASAIPQLSNDYDPFPGQPTGWSLGLLVNLEPGPAGRAAGSLAWAGLSNCYYWLDPAQGAAGVMMAQLMPFADPRALALFDRFERAVYSAAIGSAPAVARPGTGRA